MGCGCDPSGAELDREPARRVNRKDALRSAMRAEALLLKPLGTKQSWRCTSARRLSRIIGWACYGPSDGNTQIGRWPAHPRMTGVPSPSETRDIQRWMAIQYAILGGWVFALAVLNAIDTHVVVMLVFIVVSSTMIWSFVNPRRSWWGEGPRRVLIDAALLRRYQVRMTVAMVAFIVVAIPLASLILSALGVEG